MWIALDQMVTLDSSFYKISAPSNIKFSIRVRMLWWLLSVTWQIYIDVVEWSRLLDVRLSEWCCSVSMVWVQTPSREEQNFTALKSNSNTVWFNFQTYIYIYIILSNILKIAELDCCQIIILSIYVPSTHAKTHVLGLSLDFPYETR